MSNTQTDHLFKLIKTLSKSEKRNFRLYVNRVQNADDVKFVQLFDVLDRQKAYDEAEIIKKVVGIKRSQLSNLKRHLYKQLLISLRLIHIQKDIGIQIREQVDFAKILYGKGLYLQSLKILDKVKILAKDAHQDLLHLEIIEFEKLIEIRHITRSIDNRAEQLAEESDRRNEVINLSGKLSNLALRLYGMYIKIGHIKNEKDSFIIKEFFKTNLPNLDINRLTFFEKVYLYQCYVWYYFILQNFLSDYKYAQKWVEMFNKYPEMKQIDPGLYMRGMHNLLIALFYLNHFEKFTKTLEELEQFNVEHGKNFDTNTEVLAFLYISTSKFNKHFMEGSFTEGLTMIPYVEKQLAKLKPHLDQHRILVF